MNGLFHRERFSAFGPCQLAPDPWPVFHVRGRSTRLRAAVRKHAPRVPGVYGMIDGAGELIYVGKAKTLRTRLMGYFRKSRDEKAAKIIKEARGLLWETIPSEFAALLRELELIRRWQPRWNVQGQPRRLRRYYVCLGRRPAPYAFLASKLPTTAIHCFGPVPGHHTAREAVRRLNDWYRLRDCPQKQTMVFRDQQELFPIIRAPGCIRHDIGNCIGPCAAMCSQDEYSFNVQAAVEFLQGKDSSPVDILQREMNEASVGLQFERAASLRDRLNSLRWLSERLERIRAAVRHSFVYPVAGINGPDMWYVVRHGVVRAGLIAPTDEESRNQAWERIGQVFGSGPSVPGPPGLEEVDGVLLVESWFRRHAGEMAKVLRADREGEGMPPTLSPLPLAQAQ